MILGSGPNRIGQGIEFDYCCVHAAMTVRESGRDAVMVNCNPETVSTDYDTSDRLYFEPLTLEDVLAVVEVEQPLGVIVQFGGQTPLKLAAGLADARRAAARHERRRDRPGRGSRSLRRAARSAWATRRRRTRPPLARGGAGSAPTRSASRCWCAPPTCSAGGRWRSSTPTTISPTTCAARPGRGARSSSTASSSTRSRSTSTRSATAREVWIGGIMQHVEEAGVHSGDSACVLPPHSLGEEMLEQIRVGHARDRARARRRRPAQRSVRGRTRGELFVIEANPRASRTVPFVSKAIGVPLAKLACRIMLGESIARWRCRATRGARLRRSRLGQGGRAAVRSLRGLRRAARPRDALDRRGHGHRARLPDRVRQGAGRRRRGAAERGHRVHHRHRLGQAGRVRRRPDPARQRLSDRRHPWHRRGDRADGRAGAAR